MIDVDAHDDIACCLPALAAAQGPPRPPLCALDDEQSERLADDLPPVFDAHTHVFPPTLFDAIWRWFDTHGWPIREKLYAPQVIDAQRRRGHAGCLLLHYAHKPGMARALNEFVLDVARSSDGFAKAACTVFPGEAGSVDIVADALDKGAVAVKLHCHVQAMTVDDAGLLDVYALCQQRGVPVVVHAGREPHSDALPKDPYELCEVGRTARVLQMFPHLKLVVPHLGADEFDAYRALMMKHDTLWLDTTMMCASYFTGLFDASSSKGDDGWIEFVRARPDRVLYGSDSPNLPYAWDREVKALARHLPDRELEAILARNARDLFT